jgi:hypothetical protein
VCVYLFFYFAVTFLFLMQSIVLNVIVLLLVVEN